MIQPVCKESIFIEKTRELCENLLENDEFSELRKQVQDFMNDPKATGIYQQLSELRQELHAKQFNGTPPTAGEVEKYESLRQEFLEHPLSSSFIEAQQTISDMQETVAQFVGKTFELGRVPTDKDISEDVEGDCCGSGCDYH